MDALVKAALDKIVETVNDLPWDTIKVSKTKTMYREPTGQTVTESIAKAIYSVDALKSALKAI